jgi:hypothetical protein
VSRGAASVTGASYFVALSHYRVLRHTFPSAFASFLTKEACRFPDAAEFVALSHKLPENRLG